MEHQQPQSTQHDVPDDVFGDIFSEQPGQPTEPITSLEDIHDGLNDSQREAASVVDGPCFVVAGAGAGKTKTLIHRVATLIHHGVPPTQILVVTFTNKAAGEIKDRLQDMVGSDAQHIEARTFHSAAYNLMLKRFPENRVLLNEGVDPEQVTIADEKEAQKIMTAARKEALDKDELNLAKDEGWTAGHMLSRIDYERARARDINAFRRGIYAGDVDEVEKRLIVKCWPEYERMCRENHVVDFADVLMLTHKMIKQDPETARDLAQQFKYLMLDEFQDTNKIQWEIMKTIALHHRNIFGVGDEKQSIYGFNGAETGVCRQFVDEFSESKVVEIKENYRSKRVVTDVANACSDYMPGKLTDGHVLPAQPGAENGGKFNMVQFGTDSEEATMLVNAVIRDIRNGTSPDDIAILYRQRSLKAKLEEELVTRKIPYKIVGDTTFFKRKEVQDTVALIQSVFQEWHQESIKRVLTSSGRFKVSAKKCEKEVAERNRKNAGTGTYTVNRYLKELSEETLSNSNKPTKAAWKMTNFLALTEEIRHGVEVGDPPSETRERLAALWNVVLRPSLERDCNSGKGSDANLDTRVGHVKHVLDRFQKDLESGLDVDEIIDDFKMMNDKGDGMDKREKAKINLMTIHASKGLEWKNVYLMGLNNVALPNENIDAEEVAENRRLVYVGITRSRENLAMTCAKKVFLHGQTMNTKPSGFVKEIEKGLGRKMIVRNQMSSGPGYGH